MPLSFSYFFISDYDWHILWSMRNVIVVHSVVVLRMNHSRERGAFAMVGSMIGQRRRRWPIIKTTMGQCAVTVRPYLQLYILDIVDVDVINCKTRHAMWSHKCTHHCYIVPRYNTYQYYVCT